MGIKNFFEGILREIKVLKGETTKDKVYASQHRFPDQQTAASAFERAKTKLFDVNRWSELSGLTSKFELYDQHGQRSEKETPEVGDFIRILLPAPAPENWVTVTDVNVSNGKAAFTVSPSRDPQEVEEDVEHFFIKEATSTFSVELKGNTLYAAEIGKNEGVNNQGKDGGNRKLLNTLISGGGWAAFQEIQWKKLTAYLVHQEEIE